MKDDPQKKPKWYQFNDTPYEPKKILIVLGIFACGMSFIELITGPFNNITGKWGWLNQMVNGVFGPYGMTGLNMIIGAISLYAGFKKK